MAVEDHRRVRQVGLQQAVQRGAEGCQFGAVEVGFRVGGGSSECSSISVAARRSTPARSAKLVVAHSRWASAAAAHASSASATPVVPISSPVAGARIGAMPPRDATHPPL